MEQVVLVVHLIVAVCLIAVVLLQRSEGGALGIGGGGGGFMTGRGAATALSKVTWGLAAAFIATSLTLTFLAAQQRGASSVLDAGEVPAPTAPATGLGFDPALPRLGDGPAAPPVDAPLAPPPPPTVEAPASPTEAPTPAAPPAADGAPAPPPGQ
jgi:preprotein translocase subunit SecG